MPKKTYEMVLNYPKIFDLEAIGKAGFPGDIDRGDAKSEKKWLRELSKNPVSMVDAYFTSDEDLKDFTEIQGFEDKVVNPQTGEESTRIKEGDSSLGIGKYIKLKRGFNDKLEYIDKKTGDLKELDKGGAPSVKIMSAEGDAFLPYDYLTMGCPASGTEAKVRFEVYGRHATTRLEAIGITNLVEWVEYEEDEEEEF